MFPVFSPLAAFLRKGKLGGEAEKNCRNGISHHFQNQGRTLGTKKGRKGRGGRKKKGGEKEKGKRITWFFQTQLLFLPPSGKKGKERKVRREKRRKHPVRAQRLPNTSDRKGKKKEKKVGLEKGKGGGRKREFDPPHPHQPSVFCVASPYKGGGKKGN